MTRRIDRTTQKVGDKYHVWHTERLWETTRDLPIIDIQIESLKHLDGVCWFDDAFPATLRNVVEHFVRMESVDVDYPIILDSTIDELAVLSPNPKHDHGCVIILKDISKEDVPIGSEAWSTNA